MPHGELPALDQRPMAKLSVKALGRHILVEFIECNSQILDNVPIIEREMRRAAELAGATIVNTSFHHFSPHGVSGVVAIQESHLAIHTWPEHRYAAVDLFTCGASINPWAAFDHLREAFEAQDHCTLEMKRGPLDRFGRVDLSAVSCEGFSKVPPSYGEV